MGEGVAPVPAAVISQQDGSLNPQKRGCEAYWPPRGWPMFACITSSSGTAHCRERVSGHSNFLQYEISVDAEGIYSIEITTGLICAAGASFKPAMGMSFKARNDWLDDDLQKSVVAMHIAGQSLIPDKSMTLRMILAITYVISRIDRDTAPNLKRVMNIYRLG